MKIMEFFRSDHLPDDLKDISQACQALAEYVYEQLPQSAETSAGLRKLLEAKDCFVRAKVAELPRRERTMHDEMRLPDPEYMNEWKDAVGNINTANGWSERWEDVKGDEKASLDHIAAKLALIHSEVSEALEELRNIDVDDLKHIVYKDGKPDGFPIELADIIIRVMDLSDMLEIDIGKAVSAKVKRNSERGYMHGGKKL